ncbi:MAG TPA: MlaD family protein, partial [Kofleriaceae bacterium]|nr:MlaD family protein [Kofleriaceae bacterium]
MRIVLLLAAMTACSRSVPPAADAAPADYTVVARFRDASGLPARSRVVIAGLTVGEIEKVEVDGRDARVRMRIRGDVRLWPDAVVYKKSASLLGDSYLEIEPGSRAGGKRLTDGGVIGNV